MSDYKKEKDYRKVLSQLANYMGGRSGDGSGFAYYTIDDLDENGMLKEGAQPLSAQETNNKLGFGNIVVAHSKATGLVPFAMHFSEGDEEDLTEDQTVLSASELRNKTVAKPVLPKKPGWGTWAGFWHNLLGIKTAGWKRYEDGVREFAEQSRNYEQLEKLKKIGADKITDIAEEYEKHAAPEEKTAEKQVEKKIEKSAEVQVEKKAAEQEKEQKVIPADDMDDVLQIDDEIRRKAQADADPKQEKANEKKEPLTEEGWQDRKNAKIYKAILENSSMKEMVYGGRGSYESALRQLTSKENNIEKMSSQDRWKLEQKLDEELKTLLPKVKSSLKKELKDERDQKLFDQVTGRSVLQRMESAQYAAIERYKTMVPKENWPEELKTVKQAEVDEKVAEDVQNEAAKQVESDTKIAESAKKETAQWLEAGTKLVDNARKDAYKVLMDDKSSKEQLSHAMATIMACSTLREKTEYETERLEALKLGMGTMPKDPEKRSEVRQKAQEEMAKNAENRSKIGKDPSTLNNAIEKIESDPNFRASMNDPAFVKKHTALLCAKHMENEIFKRGDHYDETKQLAMSVQEEKLIAEVRVHSPEKAAGQNDKVTEATKSLGEKSLGTIKRQ